jgi:replicative DNA helicase
LPVNPDAERFVLGAVLLDDSRFTEISGLDLEDFSLDRHQTVFRRMQDLHGRGEHIDTVTVAEELRSHNGSAETRRYGGHPFHARYGRSSGLRPS